MNLVSDARQWWRWHSTYVFTVLAVFPAVWLASPELQAMLPPKLVSTIAPFVAVLGFLLRMRNQVASIPKPVAPASEEVDAQYGDNRAMRGIVVAVLLSAAFWLVLLMGIWWFVWRSG